MPWTFLDVRTVLNSRDSITQLNVLWAYQQSSPASLAYTLLGGYIVAVSAVHVAQTFS